MKINPSNLLPIIELYPCLQGEGVYSGTPSILLRFTGCNLRCTFKDSHCDTPYASFTPEKGKYTLKNIIEYIDKFPQIEHIILTGGEPTLYKDILFRLILRLRARRKFVTLETSGSVQLDWHNNIIDFLSLSPKLANSTPQNDSKGQHEINRKNYTAMGTLISCAKQKQVKFVVSKKEDLIEIKEILEILRVVDKSEVFLMPEGITKSQLNKKRKWLFNVCIKEGYNYTDRLHILAYGNKRGV